MIIQISDDWRIDSSDKQNFSLCHRVVVKEGKRAGQTDWPVEGYYSSPASCLYAAVKREIVTSEQIVDIKAFLKLYKQTAETFAQRIPAKQAEEMLQKMARIPEPEPVPVAAVEKPKRMPSKV